MCYVLRPIVHRKFKNRERVVVWLETLVPKCEFVPDKSPLPFCSPLSSLPLDKVRHMSQQFLSKYFKPAGDSNDNVDGTSTSASSSKNGAHRQGVSSAASSSSRRKGGAKRQRSSSPTIEAKVQSSVGERKAMLFDIEVHALCLHASAPGILFHGMYTVR